MTAFSLSAPAFDVFDIGTQIVAVTDRYWRNDRRARVRSRRNSQRPARTRHGRAHRTATATRGTT